MLTPKIEIVDALDEAIFNESSLYEDFEQIAKEFQEIACKKSDLKIFAVTLEQVKKTKRLLRACRSVVRHLQATQ